jgi:hypothetical protein
MAKAPRKRWQGRLPGPRAKPNGLSREPLQAGKHGAEAAQGRAASQVPPAKNSFGAQDKKEARVLKIFGIIPFGNFSNSQNFFMGLTANGLVYRYNIKEAGDGLSGEEGTQYLHVWLVEALTRAGRHDRSRLEEARLIFERRSALPTMLPLRGRHRASRRRPGKLPASFHAPRPGPRRVQLGPRAGARPIMRPGWSNDVVVRAMPYHG